MESLSHQASLKAAPESGTMASMSTPSPSSSFHGSRFFKVLGRIDEESSFRASLSNITSQDSSPRSSNNSEDSGGTDWLTPLSPESHSTFNDIRKQSLHSSQNTNINSNGNFDETRNQNVTVVTTVSKVEDSKMDAASSIENRQDRSSPLTTNLQEQEQPQYSSSSSLPSLSFDHTEDRLQQQQQKNRKEDRDKMRRENEALQKQCEELERIILQMKTEGNILQMRTVMKLKSYQTKIDRATEQKQQLETQCHELEDRIWNLRTETRLRQESIWAAEEKLQQQKKREQSRGSNAPNGTALGK